MKLLVIGSGGREHALCWKLSQSAGVELFAAPGNPGIAQIATTLGTTDFLALAQRLQPDLTIIGPEAPLAAGLVDSLQLAGLPALGPTRYAAQIESSKAFAKALMDEAGIPTARYTTSDAPAHARESLRNFGFPVVLKADGLAGGKGVIIAHSAEEVESALPTLFNISRRIVIEEFLEGPELSFIVLTDGRHIQPLEPARDYKALHDGNHGPNTGGMGAYSDPNLLSQADRDTIVDTVIEPAVRYMREHGHPFAGFLYAGLILTTDGPRVLEFNARLGDPETQPLMLRLESDLVPYLEAAAHGRLELLPDLNWRPDPAVCVVVAASGYPTNVRTGDPISGIDRVETATVFQAGTQQAGTVLQTSGGRVLGVTASGPNLSTAATLAYHGVSHIHFDGMQYRKDIGRS